MSPDALNGWGTPDDETAAEFAPVDNAPSGAGALTFAESGDGTSLYKQAGFPLADVIGDDGEAIDLGYEYTSSGQAPALQLRITGASTGGSSDFATIVWTPENGDGTWETADPDGSDQFWVTKDIVGSDGDVVLQRGATETLPEIVEQNPDAVLQAYGVQRTRDNTAEDVAVDDFQFGCETTDFEPESDGGPLGSLDVFGSLSGGSSDS